MRASLKTASNEINMPILKMSRYKEQLHVSFSALSKRLSRCFSLFLAFNASCSLTRENTRNAAAPVEKNNVPAVRKKIRHTVQPIEANLISFQLRPMNYTRNHSRVVVKFRPPYRAFLLPGCL